jgi:hypothetical protein
MTTEPHHVWYSEIDADGKTNRKCEPFGIESEAEKYVAYLHTLDYVENVIIEHKKVMTDRIMKHVFHKIHKP